MKRGISGMAVLFALILVMMQPVTVRAAEAEAHFGSNFYTETEGEDFDIGLYLESDEDFKEYSLTMTYDPAVMEYISGAASGGNGQVTISGIAENGYVKVLVHFRALKAGEITLIISEVYAHGADGEEFVINNRGNAPLSVLADNEAESVIPEEETRPTETSVDILVVSETETASEAVLTEIEIPTIDYGDNGSTGSLVTSILTQRFVLIPVILVIIVVVFVSSLVTYLEYIRDNERENRRNKTNSVQKQRKIETDTVNFIDTKLVEEEFEKQKLRNKDIYEPEEAEQEKEESNKEHKDDPVIVVDDVCMDFRVAVQNVSGIKEWMIEKVKGKISYRILHALNHVSFEIYPGEVVGIIGTNGSGKSTLLKIVSGVLRPTSGHVEADRSKIQLLTLGTGFDMELTARENVYLNGAIIGYSREFIDEHYDDIVEFAELEDFMEEKVKNFSSGMVSRLGFAIATAGDTAEILILDEVLSVGDEFFRKKSLARVKEMIHGGSTVLMVSHSMGTIKENCSKVIWIEKGELRMIGTVNTVCKAYQKMEQN